MKKIIAIILLFVCVSPVVAISGHDPGEVSSNHPANKLIDRALPQVPDQYRASITKIKVVEPQIYFTAYYETHPVTNREVNIAIIEKSLMVTLRDGNRTIFCNVGSARLQNILMIDQKLRERELVDKNGNTLATFMVAATLSHEAYHLQTPGNGDEVGGFTTERDVFASYLAQRKLVLWQDLAINYLDSLNKVVEAEKAKLAGR